MKAMILEEYHQPLVLREVAVPDIGPRDVLIKVRACGLCATDLKISQGKASASVLPLIMGHEPAGEVVQVGPAVTGLRVGDPVAVHLYLACGDCDQCIRGRDSLCTQLQGRVGFTVSGGFAEYLRVPASHAMLVPADLSYAQAAILGDAVATAHHAVVERGRVKPGETVMVTGIGGVGIHALQVAKISGAIVIAVDVKPESLALARQYGADYTVSCETADVPEMVRQVTNGTGADVVIETVGTSGMLAASLACLRPRGRLVTVGYRDDATLAVAPHRMVSGEFEILGSRASNRADLRRVIELVAAQKLVPVVSQQFSLIEVNEGMQELAAGRILSRAVVVL